MPVMESVTYGNMSYMQLAEEMAKVCMYMLELNGKERERGTEGGREERREGGRECVRAIFKFFLPSEKC